MKPLLWFATICLATLTIPAHAASRNCTLDEREAANAALVKIQNDADLSARLIRWHLPYGVPEAAGATENENLMVQGGYVMNHDNDLLTAVWTAWRLDAKDQIDSDGKDRVNCFRSDPRIKKSSERATPTDYKEDIYDQGHMTNDADIKDDIIEQVNTYVMSNMSPQHCRFNRGIWLSLEYMTRQWAREYDTVWIMAGAVFDRDGNGQRDPDIDALKMQSRNGKSRVSVPSHYYRIILRRDLDGFKSIAFLLPHTNDYQGKKWGEVRPHLENGIVPLSDIEAVAGLKLFSGLPRDLISQSADGTGWSMENDDTNTSPKVDATDRCVTF